MPDTLTLSWKVLRLRTTEAAIARVAVHVRRRRRLVLGAVASLCFTLALAGEFDARLHRFILDRAVARANHGVVLGLGGRMTSDDFRSPLVRGQAEHLQQRLDPVLRDVTRPGSGIVRVNLIGRDGTILYSDVAALRGTLLPLPITSRSLRPWADW